MIDFILQTGAWKTAVSAIYEATKAHCAGYLCQGTPHYSVTMTLEDLRFERDARMRQDEADGRPPHAYSGAYLEIEAVQRKVTECLFHSNILLFHGSAVAVDGEVYLFIAESGTGKSTHAALWRQILGDRAVMVNDDKPFLEIRKDGVIAHGSPWNGAHKQGNNISLPVKAICILQRGQSNKIEKISFKYSLFMLLQQSKRPSKNVEKYMELIEQLAHKVSFYRLQCNTDPDAAWLAYKTMSETNIRPSFLDWEGPDLDDIYARLKDRYPLTLTNSFSLNDGYTEDFKILRGSSEIGIFDLYNEGDMGVFSVQNHEGTAGTHVHPTKKEQAFRMVVDFMEGRLDFELTPFNK